MTKKLSPEELALWKANTKDVRILPTTLCVPPSKPRPLPRQAPALSVEMDFSSLRPAPPPASAFGKKNFRRAQVESYFDMHGLTLQTAPDRLARFLSEAQGRGIKIVLVVTGKGALGETQTLRHQLPRWLNEPPLCQLVCAFHHPAKIQDGGQGAFYVELRKRSVHVQSTHF